MAKLDETLFTVMEVFMRSADCDVVLTHQKTMFLKNTKGRREGREGRGGREGREGRRRSQGRSERVRREGGMEGRKEGKKEGGRRRSDIHKMKGTKKRVGKPLCCKV